MKKLFFPFCAALLSATTGGAESLQSAEVTRVVNDVRIYRPTTSAKKAAPGDTISGKTSLQTGRRSRSELKFQDDTLTRIGANSIFSFDRGTRDLSLERGTLLLSVPKGSGGARIRTATVTAAVTGTTIMMEYFSEKWVKIIVLEGSLETWVERNGKKTKKTIKAGQMMVLKADDRRMPDPVTVDLGRLLGTSGLADVKTFGPLPPTAQKQIASVLNQQSELKSEGFLVPVTQTVRNPVSGGPATGGTSPGQRSTDNRQLVSESVPPPPTEGDEAGGAPSGRGSPGEGDEP